MDCASHSPNTALLKTSRSNRWNWKSVFPPTGWPLEPGGPVPPFAPWGPCEIRSRLTFCFYHQDFFIFCFIITITISSYAIGVLAVSFCTVVIGQCNRTVGRNRTPVIGQLKQPIILQPNPPITELITITIATTTYPRRNCGISKMRKIFTLNFVSTGGICRKCICCFQKL